MTVARAAADICAAMVRERDFELYAATLFVPPEPRRGLLALAAFRAEIAHVRDHVSQPLPGEIRLQWWTDALEGLRSGEVEGNPVASELVAAIARHGLPVAPLLALIETHIFDLYGDPMPDWPTLETYLDQTSGTLLALGAQVLGGTADAIAPLAHHAGRAVGLADLVAGLPLHAARHQLYLPRPLLETHGVNVNDIFAGTATPALRAALAEMMTAARVHLDTARGLLSRVQPKVRPAFLPLVAAAHRLDQASQPDYDLFRPAQPSRLAILWRFWRAMRAPPFHG